ncbi:glycosyltransferase family 4 protein [Bacillaceae bacterium OS4b]|nr:glycosyltransferase family 4 protein [Bacillaceae bacterium OS4b]
MKIGIDGRKLTKNKTGIGNYLENMLQYILKYDSVNEYYIFTDREIKDYKFNNINIITVNKFNTFIKSDQIYQPIWLNIVIPFYFRKYGIDIFWGPNFVKPLTFPSQKSILTIHDLAFKDVKEYHSGIHSIYLNLLLKIIIDKKINLLTVSNFSKSSILKHFPILTQDQIEVTYCSYNSNLFPGNLNKDYEDIVKKKYNLYKDYILFVGTTTARKNLENVIKAIYLSKIKNGNSINLVVVGAKGNGLSAIKKLVKEYSIEEHIHFLGYVEEDHLPYIYKMAKIFIFPSFYEGFGIPILEAMVSGTPVITSNVTSLPEVGGNAVYYIDPYSPEDISNAICEVLINSKLRSELVEFGFKRVQRFKWDDSAKVFISNINKIKNKYF